MDEDLPAEPLTAYQQHLVHEYLGLAQKLGLEAWRRACISPLPSLPSPEKYEFVGLAYIGLIQAAIKFDPERRPEGDDGSYDPFLGFSAYARRRVNGAIMDWQRKLDHLPKRQRKIYRDMEKKGYGSGQTIEMLATELELPPEKIRAVIRAAEEQAIELDALYSNPDSENDMHDFVRLPTQAVEGSALVLTVQDSIASLIQDFPVLQKRILTLRHYEQYEFSRIATTLEISPTLVRTMYQEALQLLHERFRHAAM